MKQMALSLYLGLAILSSSVFAKEYSNAELNTKILSLSRHYEQVNDKANERVNKFDALIDLGITGEKLLQSEPYADLQELYFEKQDALHSINVLLDYAKDKKKRVTENVDQIISTNHALSEDLLELQATEATETTNTTNTPNTTDTSDKRSLTEQQAKLTPLKIEPSTGPKGNITGTVFPDGAWALTFDDGPSLIHTPKVIANLNEIGIKATFFVLAQNLSARPELAKLIKDSNQGLANHSYTHPQLTKLGPQALDYEIRQSTEKETTIWGYRPKFFRCPYGSGTNVASIRQRIADQKMIHVFWNVDSLDWQDKNPETVYLRTVRQMRAEKKGVILFHDIHPQSVIASRKVMQFIKEQKLRAVTLEEIVDEINGK